MVRLIRSLNVFRNRLLTLYNMSTESNLTILLRSRVEFFRRYRSDRSTMSFLHNENRLMSMIASEQSSNIFRNVSISLSPLLGSFLDPVTVAPTQQQIDHAFTVPDPAPEGSCPICQEALNSTDPTIRLRNCRHCFHRECATSWYRMSVYCPVCRNDIRTGAS